MSMRGPKELDDRCPGCGSEGEEILLGEYLECPNEDCRVKEFEGQLEEDSEGGLLDL